MTEQLSMQAQEADSIAQGAQLSGQCDLVVVLQLLSCIQLIATPWTAQVRVQ